MIDNSEKVFGRVADELRKKFKGIYITGAMTTTTPPSFPCVHLRLYDNPVVSRYSDFQHIEKVVEETYYIEITSNLVTNKEKECIKIANVIDEVMESMGYMRVFNKPIAMIDVTLARRVMRYRKLSTED